MLTGASHIPLRAGLVLALGFTLFLLAPKPAVAHDSCTTGRAAASMFVGTALSDAGDVSSVLAGVQCTDKFDDVNAKIDRDFEVSDADAQAGADEKGKPATFAKCKDGMAAGMFACHKVDMLSYVSHAELGTTFVNDVWGWTDPKGHKDYVLAGARNGTVFIDISDPKRPKVQGIMPTASTAGGSSWRDIKVYKDHAYVVSEHTNHGVQVFDLTRLRDWDGTYTTYAADARYTRHGSAHNININPDTGFLYSVGAGAFSSGGQPNRVIVDAPSSAAGTYDASGAAFGPRPPVDTLTGSYEVVNDGSANPSQGCGELAGFTAGAIAVVDRGTCTFAAKVLNAQNAGAVAVVVVNNAPGAPTTLGGAEPQAAIPAVMVSQADGATIKSGLPAAGGVRAIDPPPVCGTGLHMIDINSPKEPQFAGCFDGHGYVHDTQCVVYDGPAKPLRGRELCFNSNATTSAPGGEHRVAVVDVTDKANPVALAREPYANDGYSHQGWLTPDQKFFLHGDELDEQRRGITTTTRVWDVQDPANPELVQVFTNNRTSIDHNVYTEGKHAYASNYTSGLRVLDTGGLPKENLSEEAFFDIYPENDNATFEGGTWSNYPYFHKKHVVAVGSMDRGLFILEHH